MSFQQDLVQAAIREWEFFGKDLAGKEKYIGGKRKETVSPYAERVGDYWLSVPSADYNRLVKAYAQKYGKLDGTINIPWSAAFISYCMQIGGAGSYFPYASGHATWIVRAIRNRLAGKPRAALVGYRTDELPLEPGDLIGAGRGKDKITYDNAPKKGWFISHTDIVVDVDVAKRRAFIVGGNVSQTVARGEVQISKDGRLTDKSRPWMVHIRNNIVSAPISALAQIAPEELRVG